MRPGHAVLLILGLAQMAGDVLGVPAIQGLAAATAASPAPKVFSTVQGLETFSTEFFVEWEDTTGESHSILLTPEVYRELEGTYNRRNTYGAAVAYAPIFANDARTRGLLVSVGKYALCGEAPLVREFGIDPVDLAGPIRLRLAPREGTEPKDLPLELAAPCE